MMGNNNDNQPPVSSSWHGTVVSSGHHWDDPVRTLTSSKKARPEYTDVDAHEYNDQESVLNEKVALLAEWVRRSQYCVAYTGAGLSVSSGLDDYASDRTSSSGAQRQPQQRGDGPAAHPNAGHKALAKLHMAGHLKAVVNQNHDGLLQKAGYPQAHVNEIHGSWFDPSNPGGNILREDLFEDLQYHERHVDLCLALGSSLSGLNADRLAKAASKRSLCTKGRGGLVVCNLQRTPLDPRCQLRIFAPLDKVLTMLTTNLLVGSSSQAQVEVPPPPQPSAGIMYIGCPTITLRDNETKPKLVCWI